MDLYVNGIPVPSKISTFKGGEVFFELGTTLHAEQTITIEAYIKNSNDLMVMFSVLQLVQEAGCKVYIFLPYMPYARQDRKMNPRQANQSEMFWRLLSGYKDIIKGVQVCDVHSQAALKETFGLSVHNTTQRQLLVHEYRTKFAWISECDAIVAPDEGAYEKAKAVADHFKLPVVVCSKVRASTGEIIKTTVEGDTKDKRLVVIDDIVDGGRTFLGIADKIKDAKELNLVCTHGIFSYGKEILQEKFNRIEAVYDWTLN